MRIGLFGGRFDPPHLGHLLLAEEARETAGLDEVWFLPTGDPPHKGTVASAAHRLAMVRLATADHPDFRVHEAEVAREGGTYAIDTVEALRRERPDASFAYLIGADAYARIADWHRPDDLVRAVRMLVLPRPGADLDGLEPRFRDAARVLDAVPFGVSSTLVRERAAAGRGLRYLVPPPVIAYLREHALYAPEPGEEAPE